MMTKASLEIRPTLPGSKINACHQGSHTAMPVSKLGMSNQLGETRLDQLTKGISRVIAWQ